MNRLPRIALAAMLILGMLSMPTMAQATTDVTYTLSGSEIWATEFTGVFVGIGVATDDYGIWQATIDHDSVPTKKNKSALVTDGSFAFDGNLRDLAGTIDSGSITLETDVRPCGKQTYRVEGHLTLTSANAGTADFEAVVTHHRIVVWGRCITYAATVTGSVAFHLT